MKRRSLALSFFAASLLISAPCHADDTVAAPSSEEVMPALPASFLARAIAVGMGVVYGASQQLATNMIINMSLPSGDPSDPEAFKAQQKLQESFSTGIALLSVRESGTINDFEFMKYLRSLEARLLAKYTQADEESLRKPHKVGHEIGVAAANLAYIYLRRFKKSIAL